MNWFSKAKTVLGVVGAVALLAAPAWAQVANVKVVTDANPDYSDMESMVRSITKNWTTDQEKMYALFYWDHIARRQTAPMELHGYEMTDPIRQFNDYGYTMCSTISGIKCGEWTYMGYPCRLFDISNHTVPDVWYDGAFHHYDNSLSMMYTMPDGKTIASVEDVGKTMSGPETGGAPVRGYIALYHALTGTSPNGYCEGADTERPLSQIVQDFTPRGLKYRFYYYNYDLGHRYILNLRDGETYTRYYSRQDAKSPDASMRPAKDRSQGMHCPLTNLNSVTYSEMQRGICRIQPPIVNCYRTLQMTRKAPWGLINSETLGRPGRYRMEHRYGRRLETEPSLTAD